MYRMQFVLIIIHILIIIGQSLYIKKLGFLECGPYAACSKVCSQ